jgi:Flp pilus assembly protein TadD
MHATTNGYEGLGAQMARDLREGRLTLAQAAGLTGAELDAIDQVARHLRRRGDLAGAADVLGLLLAYDPFSPERWQAMGRLLQRMGNPEPARVCLQMQALLNGQLPHPTEGGAR